MSQQETTLTVHPTLQDLLHKAIDSVELYLEVEAVRDFRLRMGKIRTMGQAIRETEVLLGLLVGKIQGLVKAGGTGGEDDYGCLEKALQKAEAEIRSHVKIEQQLKIYIDGMEQRLEQLQKQLESRTQKYSKLYQAMKAFDAEKKELKKKLKYYEIKAKESDMPHHKHSYIVSESSVHDSQSSVERIYLDKGRATRIKQFLDQSSDKKYRKQPIVSEKKKRLNSEIEITAIHLENRKNEAINLKTEPRGHPELAQTLKPKLIAKPQSRSGKFLKNATEDTGKRKQTRSNSVCS